MPWSDYPANVRQFKTLVESAAYARFGSAATVEAVSLAARDARISLSFADYSSIAKMYGEWVGVRNSNEVVANATAESRRTGFDVGIDASMIGRPPYAPSPADTIVNPFVLVTGRFVGESPEGPITSFFSHRYHISELHTLQQIEADLGAQVEQIGPAVNSFEPQLQEIVSMEWSTP